MIWAVTINHKFRVVTLIHAMKVSHTIWLTGNFRVYWTDLVTCTLGFKRHGWT